MSENKLYCPHFNSRDCNPKLISEFLEGLDSIHTGLFQAFGEGDYLHYIEEEQMKWRRRLNDEQ